MRALRTLMLSVLLVLGLTHAGAAAPEPGGRDTNVTLLTGDQITLSANGSATVRPAKGREHIPITRYRDNGHLHVVPADAGRLIATRKLDPRLFDVTELVRLGYHDDATIPVIHADGSAGRASKGASWRSLTTGGTLWLDGVRTLSLDKTVPQIGAPAAWQAGLTGAGVTVAVLDTGVDQAHADLVGQEVAERNFGDSPDNVDRIGHGTHVASTIAGTGATYHGVASDARLLDAKVFDDDGFARDSAIINALRWAADQGARIANLSLGGEDLPGLDPIEAVVEELSASHGLLVVAAAGNSYRPETIGSPASADAALAVGAVDKADALADFSSRGPRLGDGGVKPDLVAPGVGVVAAKPGGGYADMDGTSMATPHVSGAAALLAQRHPNWTGDRLKAALVGSSAPVAGGEYDRGAGRVDVARAIGQTVTAAPANLGLGVVVWPHTGAVEKPLTYRNNGPADVPLELSVTGAFTLDTDRVTVPAGGTAPVTVRAPGSTADGARSGVVTASAAGVSVVTPVSVLHEPKSHTLTIDMVGRDGAPAADYFFKIASLDRQWADFAYEEDGRFTLRLPAGHYLIDAGIQDGNRTSVLASPALPLLKDSALTFDARTAKPVSITPPDPGAELQLLDFGVATHRPGTRPFYFATAYTGSRLAVGHVGPAAPKGHADVWFNSQWTAGPQFYGLAWFWDGRVPTGLVKRVDRADLATVRARMDIAGPGGHSATPAPRGGFDPAFPDDVTFRVEIPVDLPGEHVAYFNTAAQWSTWLRNDTIALRSPSRTYRAGHTYRERFGHAVFGPVLPPTAYPTPGAARFDDAILVDVPIFGDAAGNAGWSLSSTRDVRLYRDGVEIPADHGWFVVPPEPADYRLTSAETRTDAPVSTAVDVAWTFRSGHVDGTARLPLAVVRFTPELDAAHSAPRGRFLVPVALQRADGSQVRPKRLTVEVSYDLGATWRVAPTHSNRVAVLTHPARAASVSLRATAADGGTTVRQTIIRAYLLR